jgi:aminoglycoside phosphotransferase (APT) family kinase protein
MQGLMQQQLATYLEQNLPGFSGPVEIEKFDQGQSNPTFMLVNQGQRYVMRRKPPGELLASAHAVDREFRVLRALADTPVPVPQALHLCEDDSVIGSMFYIMSYEPGRIFWDPALPDVAKDQRVEILKSQVSVLAAMHDVDVDAVGLTDYGPRENYYERQIARWVGQYRAAETETLPAMEKLIDWLSKHLPASDGQLSLIHGDYRLDNLIYHPTEPEVVAVLDWELSTLGHPLADLAYLCMCMRLPDSGAIIGLGGKNRDDLGLPSEQDLIEQYCCLRNLGAVDNWPFYLAFSFFRLAAICQGVYKRAQLGNASDTRAATRANITGDLATMGLQVTSKNITLDGELTATRL